MHESVNGCAENDGHEIAQHGHETNSATADVGG